MKSELLHEVFDPHKSQFRIENWKNKAKKINEIENLVWGFSINE